MRKWLLTLGCLVFVTQLLVGCGVKFAPVAINSALPEGLKERTIYPDGGAAYDLEDLVGNVVLQTEVVDAASSGKKNKYIKVGVILPKDFVVTVKPIKDSLMYYHSRIDRSAAAQGSYLAFSSTMDANQLAELTIFDTAIISSFGICDVGIDVIAVSKIVSSAN